jgi:hypothetical protein
MWEIRFYTHTKRQVKTYFCTLLPVGVIYITFTGNRPTSKHGVQQVIAYYASAVLTDIYCYGYYSTWPLDGISTLSKALCCWVRGLVSNSGLESYAGTSVAAGSAIHAGQVSRRCHTKRYTLVHQVGWLGVGLTTSLCKKSLPRNLTYRKAGWIIRHDKRMNQKMEVKNS